MKQVTKKISTFLSRASYIDSHISSSSFLRFRDDNRQVKSPRPLSLFLSLSSLSVLLSRGSSSRFRARSLTLSCTASRTYLAESREARRRSGLAAAAAARSPSEVKVRRVGTGCARIHFFGLALDFFPSSRTARRAAHQFPMYAPPT